MRIRPETLALGGLVALLASGCGGGSSEEAAPHSAPKGPKQGRLFGVQATKACLERRGFVVTLPDYRPFLDARRGSNWAILSFAPSEADARRDAREGNAGNAGPQSDAVDLRRNVVVFYLEPIRRVRKLVGPCLNARLAVPADQVMVGLPRLEPVAGAVPAVRLAAAASHWPRLVTRTAAGLVVLRASTRDLREIGIRIDGPSGKPFRGQAFSHCGNPSNRSTDPGVIIAEGPTAAVRMSGRIPAAYELPIATGCEAGARPRLSVEVQTDGTVPIRVSLVGD